MLIIDGTYDIERRLHKKFLEYRITGEWFEYGGRLETFVLENQDKDRKYEFGFILGDFTENEHVHRLRKKHHLTLSDLGEKLHITAQSVKEIQDREKSGVVSINVLRNVAEALGYRLEYRFTPISGK